MEEEGHNSTTLPNIPDWDKIDVTDVRNCDGALLILQPDGLSDRVLNILSPKQTYWKLLLLLDKEIMTHSLGDVISRFSSFARSQREVIVCAPRFWTVVSQLGVEGSTEFFKLYVERALELA